MSFVSLDGRAQNGVVTEDKSEEVDPAAKPKRRTFKAGYKAKVLAEFDAAPRGGAERGAILRREGLYSSHITEWRKQAAAGARQGLAAKSKKRRSKDAVELEKLRRKNQRLEAELKKTRTALEITGKVQSLLEQLSESDTGQDMSK